MLQKLATTARMALGLPRKISEEEFKRWRRESTDPVVRSGKCYVPMQGFENRKHYSDKQNLHHLGRYEWACKVLTSEGAVPARLLDCACGVGYGTASLAGVVGAVDAIDGYGLAIARARTFYDQPNITWHDRDVGEMRSLFVDEAFDAIVCFQTVECIEDDKRFLDDLQSMLKPGGVLLIDTPVRARHEDAPENPHHKRYYSLDEWLDMLTGRFDKVRAFEDLPEADLLKACGMPSTGSIAHCVK